jgi:amidase
VTSPVPAIDPRVWRIVGSPLLTGSGEGPLAGHTIAVKDLFALAGFRRGLGVRAYLKTAPIEFETAPAVKALLDAGANVVGIAQTDQFAYSIAGLNPDYGVPPNPAVPGAVPGGSSSGPASAVALGQASIGLGTDTAGSIRVPASYQGLWGLRPTHGAIPLQGVAPLAPSYDTVGYITRDGETLLAVATIGLSGAPTVRPAQRVLVPDSAVTPDPDVSRAFREATNALAPNAERVTFPPFSELFDAFRVTQQAEAWRADGQWVKANPGTLAGDVAARFAAASGVTAQREREALAERDRLAAILDEVLGDAVLLIPAAASAAPLLNATDDELEAARAATLGLTTIAGITGRPALSVPMLRVPGGPVGISLVGPRGSDLTLIRMAISWARNTREISSGHAV